MTHKYHRLEDTFSVQYYALKGKFTEAGEMNRVNAPSIKLEI